MSEIYIQTINAETGETEVRDATPEEVEEITATQSSSSSVPYVVSRRQFILALYSVGFITAAEAIAAAKTGEVPAAISALFALLPLDQAVSAQVTWASMTEVQRNHPLIEAAISSGLATAEQVDDLFRLAAEL